jgi:hypothetical protein
MVRGTDDGQFHITILAQMTLCDSLFSQSAACLSADFDELCRTLKLVCNPLTCRRAQHACQCHHDPRRSRLRMPRRVCECLSFVSAHVADRLACMSPRMVCDHGCLHKPNAPTSSHSRLCRRYHSEKMFGDSGNKRTVRAVKAQVSSLGLIGTSTNVRTRTHARMNACARAHTNTLMQLTILMCALICVDRTRSSPCKGRWWTLSRPWLLFSPIIR